MDGVADLQAGQVDLEEFRDLVGAGAHGDLVADDVEHAAALDAGRCALVLEVHRHLRR